MARAGFEIINDNDILLINDSYMNFALTRKVKVSTLPYWFANINSNYMIEGSKFSCRKINLNSNEKIAFLGGVSGDGSIDGFTIKDQSSAYNGENAYYVLLRRGVDAESLYMYVFGEYVSVGDSLKYGLQVFDSANSLVYSSNKKPLKVLHYATANDGFQNDSTKTIAFNIDNVYYQIPYTKIGSASQSYFINGKSINDPYIIDCVLMPYMSRYYKSFAPSIINGKVVMGSFHNEHNIYGIGDHPIASWNGFVYTIIDVTNF